MKLDAYKIDKFKMDGPSGSSIKSVQRGATQIDSGQNTKTLSISSVDLSKAVVKFTAYNPAETDPANCAIRVFFIDHQQLYFIMRANVDILAVQIFWEVIEFNNVKSIQRGSVTSIAGGGQTITISEINPAKSFVFASHSHTLTGAAIVRAMVQKLCITDSTTLTHSASYNQSDLEWQVIEFY
jgi:hypothetical protein